MIHHIAIQAGSEDSYGVVYDTGATRTYTEGDLPKTARDFLRDAHERYCWNDMTYCVKSIDDLPDGFRRHLKRPVNAHLYGMRLRGFAPGCQPMHGFIERLDDDGTHSRRYHDILAYSDKLDDQEVSSYELDYIGKGCVLIPV